jgi:hypothetical protein
MNQESEFASRIARHLTQATRELDVKTLHRLRSARESALEKYREPVRLLGLVPVGGPLRSLRNTLRERPLAWVLPGLVALALGIYTSTNDDDVAELGELDAAIISSDVPLRALVDRDFRNLLKSDQ